MADFPIPNRIQRQRTKGWRMPEGYIYVGRPTMWGNPFAVAGATEFGQRLAVEGFRDEVAKAARRGETPPWVQDGWSLSADDEPLWQLEDWLRPLRGRSLACWCRLDRPCHADVLLEIANA